MIDNEKPLIVDSHAHFWRWPETEEAERARDIAAHAPAAYAHPPLSPGDLLQEMDAAYVDKLIQVTRTAMGYDNSYSLEGAAAYPDRIRVLARFDPMAPDPAGRLRRLLSDPFVVGIRVHHFPPDDRWLSDGTYEPVWNELARLGRPASVYLPDGASRLMGIAAKHPDLTLIVDHAAVDIVPPGDPGRRFDRWNDVLEMSEAPNIVVKVSGLPEATEEPYPFPVARERVRDLVEVFGASRLMWGSNFPPTARVCSYGETLDLIRLACDCLDDGERTEILGGTARRFLDLPW